MSNSSQHRADKELAAAAMQAGTAFYIITSQRDIALARFQEQLSTAPAGKITVLTCDATAIKTAARADLVLYKMQGPVVQDKWGWADFEEVVVK